MTKKVEECLHNVALGLAANSGLSIAPLLIFIHGVISLSIPELRLPVQRVQQDPNMTASGRPLRTDSLILAPVPKRKVAAAASSTQPEKETDEAEVENEVEHEVEHEVEDEMNIMMDGA